MNLAEQRQPHQTVLLLTERKEQTERKGIKTRKEGEHSKVPEGAHVDDIPLSEVIL